MNIDHSSPEHPYRQLAAWLRRQIWSREISGRLPSLTTLTAQTGLATGTVRRAVDLLAGEGLVCKVPGRGTFVIPLGRAAGGHEVVP